MDAGKKSHLFALLCIAAAAVMVVDDAAAQALRRSSSSRGGSSLRDSRMGYDSRLQGSQYSSSRGGLGGYDQGYGAYGTDQRGRTLRDQRSRSTSRLRSNRYQDPLDQTGRGRAGDLQGRLTPQQERTEKAQEAQRAGDRTRPRTARPSGAARKPGAAETGVDVAKATQPGTPPQPGQRPGRGQRGQPAKPKEVKPLVQWPTFYLTLNANQIVLGDVFSMDLHLSNPKKAGFDRLAVVLEYDPVFLRPVKGPPAAEGETPEPAVSMIDEVTASPARTGVLAAADAKNDPYIQEAYSRRNLLSLYENVVDSEAGTITYMFEVENETATAGGRVASIYFEALQPTRRTFVSFRFAKPSADHPEIPDGPGTVLLRDDKDILGMPLRPDDGTVARGITVLSEKPSKHRVRSLEPRGTGDEFYATHLRLLPERRHIVVGEEFNVYVELENPDRIRFDQISLLLAYNPRVLQVVDYDADNAITRGVNVHDGSYRDTFPFDFFIVNNADVKTGLIDYRMRGYRRPLLSEGVLACVRFRALKSTSKTTLRVFADRDGQEPTTGVFYRLKDVLGDSGDPTDGISTCSFQIGRLRSASAGGGRVSAAGG